MMRIFEKLRFIFNFFYLDQIFLRRIFLNVILKQEEILDTLEEDLFEKSLIKKILLVFLYSTSFKKAFIIFCFNRIFKSFNQVLLLLLLDIYWRIIDNFLY